jgi:hypothetical protein
MIVVSVAVVVVILPAVRPREGLGVARVGTAPALLLVDLVPTPPLIFPATQLAGMVVALVKLGTLVPLARVAAARCVTHVTTALAVGGHVAPDVPANPACMRLPRR